MGIAVVGSRPDRIDLHNFDDVTVFTLPVKEPGVYVVFGRVSFFNGDNSMQNGTVRLTHSNGVDVIDKTDLRLPGFTRCTVNVQGTLRVDSTPTSVEFRCQTFDGGADDCSLFAVQVDDLRFD
jgi:hypothetical protein